MLSALPHSAINPPRSGLVQSWAEQQRYQLTGCPGFRFKTWIPDPESFSSSCSGRPVRMGKVP